MKKVVSVVFKNNPRRYYFSSLPGLKLGDFVIVETVRGFEMGNIIEEEKEIDESEITGELKPVVRKATDKDLDNHKKNLESKEECNKICNKVICESGIEMKFIDSEYTIDRTKLIVYFRAADRVDFRELVKTLAFQFKTRIEMRQVAENESARICGGFGRCGRETCCTTHLYNARNSNFKMLKNQSIAPNKGKIEGLCGKLLCCYSFEDSTYTELKKDLPEQNQKVNTPDGVGFVQSANIISKDITVRFFDKSIRMYNIKDIDVINEENKEEEFETVVVETSNEGN